jgi:DNA repair photolyase
VSRDAELLARIGRANSVSVHLTITTLDEALARLLEPRAPRPVLRVAALRQLTDAGVRVGVLAHPMMPLINDSEKSIEAVCAAAVANGASSFSASPLFLKPCAQRVFFPFLEQHFPHLLGRYQERYQANAYLNGHYPEMIRLRVQKVLSRHKLPPREPVEWPVDDQLDLFAEPKPHLQESGTSGTLHRKVDGL